MRADNDALQEAFRLAGHRQEPTETIAARNPWSPFAIAVLTLLFSPVAGGILHGLNYARLGQGRLRRFVLARNLLASLLFILFAVIVQARPGLRPAGVDLFFAAYFYKSQQSLFQDCLSQGGRKGSLVSAILISLLVVLGALLFVVGLSVLL
jgi:hypothetical protein